MSSDCFHLKGSVITMFILEFNAYDSELFKQQLAEKVTASPDFFKQSPVIINFEKLDLENTPVNYAEIISICKESGLVPVAFKQSPHLNLTEVEQTGLGVLNERSGAGDTSKAQVAKQETLPEHVSPSKIITKPVRSGQQIYAEGSDLIIIGSVSGGAEVLADGNIHIYGTLRGRALAGVSGNVNARIFCSGHEAELVSIAGQFSHSDSLETDLWKKPAQYYLEDEVLHVSPL